MHGPIRFSYELSHGLLFFQGDPVPCLSAVANTDLTEPIVQKKIHNTEVLVVS